MNTFSDDELKRLKAQSEDEVLAGMNGDLVMVTELKALINRLEAAEEFADGAALAFPSLKLGHSYSAWQRSRGEGS